MQISAGTRLGPYEVVAPLGAGGMGEVWRGRDTRLDRSVAIKVLPADLAQNAQFKLRFEREARAISQLNHPNICTLYDVGDSYIVMELLEGESLADRVAKGPLPVEQVLRYGVQIGDALDKAHRSGIIHRDLKPGNIMITRSGAKLLDFGLAKSNVNVVDGESLTQHRALTQEGTILGTFQYMAPEQLEGLEADARTDIFALGALLYEMSTGRRAFQGATKTSLIAAIVTGEPAPMSQIQPLTPPALEHVVRKCLAKDREDRWQSAHDIAEELRWISEAGSQAGVATPLTLRRKSRERLGWATAVALALVTGIFAARGLHLGEAHPQYRFTIPMIDSGYRGGSLARLSPDGQTVYFAATNEASKRQIFRRRLDDLKAIPIEGTEDVANFLPTPDGRSLLLSFAGAVIKRIDVNGGPLETVAEGAPGNVTVSREGTVLLGSDDRPVRRLLPNHELQPITNVDSAHGETGHSLPYFLPDGRKFLFLAASRDAQRGTIRRVLCGTTLGSKEVIRIGEVSSRVEYSHGYLFFVRGGTLMAQPFDPSRFKFSGEAIPIADNVAFSSRNGNAAFSVANDGTILYSPFAPPHRLTFVDSSGKKLSTISPAVSFSGGTPFGSRFAVLPDSSRVVIQVSDYRNGTSSLWIYGLNRETAARLTFSSALEFNPVVTSDGAHVFFSSDAQSPPDIYDAPIDGAEPPKLRVAATNAQIPEDISPDGRFLLYMSNQNQINTKQDLWILPLAEGGKPYPYLATPAIENDGTFSRDGKWIAYASDVTGTFQIYARPFPGAGSARPVSTKGGHTPRFSRDGRKLYFTDGAKLMVADFHADGSTGEPTIAFELRDQITTFEPMPAGDRFLMLSQNEVDAAPPARVIVGWQPPKR